MTHRYIDSDAALAAGVERWRRHGVVGIDTEFIRTRTFYPIPALYQLAADGDVFLLDPTTIAHWQPFAALLADPDVTIIMHSCSEDLEVFSRHLGVAPTRIFDTQIANAFVSDRYSVSYSALVSEYLGVALGKQETRSDWLKRPLSAEQLAYAAADVEHLEPLQALLRERLQELGRLSWFSDECAAMTAPKVGAPEDYYRGIRKAAYLNPRQLARLQRLCVWRERQVRDLDVPRARFLADDVLVDLARSQDMTADELQQLLRRAAAERKAGRRPRALAGDILALLDSADRSADDARPPPLDAPLSRADNIVIAALKEQAQARAAALQMAPELLARRRDLEACLRHYLAHGELSDVFRGWRYPHVGAAFERLLAAHAGTRGAPNGDRGTAADLDTPVGGR